MIKAKLSSIGKDIFTVISELVQNTEIINLAKISPDISCDDKLTELAIKYIREKSVEYTHPNGLLELRKEIAKNIKQKRGINIDPKNEVTITAGATQAMYTAISAFVNEGDEVVLFEPAFNSYVPAIESNGGRPVFVLRKQPDYHIDWESVQKLINTRTKLIIVNTPHNPTGAIFNEEDIAQIRKITNGTNINVISDEVFEHLVFNNQKHLSILSDEKLAQRSVIIFSFGISLNIPGWKIGYCVGSEEIMKKIRKKHHFQINTINTPLQYALADYLKNGIDFKVIKKQFEYKKSLVNGILKDSRFNIIPSNGTFYQLLNYSNISDEKDTEFAKRIMEEYGVALFPLSVFYHDAVDNKILGFSFARDNKILEQAARQLLEI